MKWILALLMTLTISQSVDACGRCGLFGRRCRFVSVSNVKAVAVQAVPQTIVFNNSYPAAQPGLSAYVSGVPSYQASAVSYQPTAAIFANLAREALALSSQNAQLGAQQANVEAALQSLTLQRDQIVRQMQAIQSRGSVTFTIHPDGRVTQQQGSTPPTNGANNDVPPAPTQNVIALKCGKCHNKQDPAGGLFMDGVQPMSDENFRKVMEVAVNGKTRDGKLMPPQSAPRLTKNEKAVLLEQLLSLK